MSVAIGPYYTTSDVAELLGVNESRVRQFHLAGRLVGERVGAILLFKKSDVDKFAEIERPTGRPAQQGAEK